MTLQIYEWLQTKRLFASTRTDIVTVVDISKLPGGQNEEQVTNREVLEKIVCAIAEFSPKAIAVDIDFSPPDAQPENAPLPETDQRFFDVCESISKEKKIPVFLGIGRRIGDSPMSWLGDPKYKGMAASVGGYQFDACRLPIWIKRQEDSVSLPALSWAAAGLPTFQLPSWLSWAIRAVSQRHDPDLGFEYADALVNYNGLEDIKKRTIQASDEHTIREASSDRFSNRIVIIGNGTDAYDQFVPPGHAVPWPGVFMHACAAETFALSPIYELRPFARFGLDVMIALAVFGALTHIRLRINDRQERLDKSSRIMRAIWITTIFVLIGGVVLVLTLSLLWHDFFAVVLAIPIDQLVLNKLTHLGSEGSEN